MKNKSRRLLAVFLSLATATTLMVGCSSTGSNAQNNSKSGSNSTIDKDGFFHANSPVTVSMLFSDNQAYPYKDSWQLFNDLKEKTNVTINLTIVPMSDYNSKRSVLIASGQEPEVIPKTYPGQEDQYVTSSQILPISDYASQMPYFTKEIKDWKLSDDLKTITQGDGKYYIMPGLHQSFVQDYALCIRTDILKKNNISMPQSWDDFETMLKQLKQLYPNITPFSDRWQLGATMQLAGPSFVKTATGLKGTDADWTASNLLLYDQKKNSFSFYPTADGYKAELAYFNKLVNEGLLDKESLTQTSNQAMDKFFTGKSFVIACNSSEMKTYRTKMAATLGTGNFEIAKLNVLSGPAGSYIQGNRLENGVMISKKAKEDKNFKTILAFVDWLWNSDTAQEFCKWGVQGETYTKSGTSYKLMSGYKNPAYGIAGSSGDKDMRNDLGFANGNFILSYGGSDTLAHSYMTDEDIQWSENVNKTRTLLPNAPKVAYDEDTNESQTLLNSTLKDYMNQTAYKFILGQMNISSDWDSYVKQFQSKGSDKYTKTANDAYAKQLKKK